MTYVLEPELRHSISPRPSSVRVLRFLTVFREPSWKRSGTAPCRRRITAKPSPTLNHPIPESPARAQAGRRRRPHQPVFRAHHILKLEYHRVVRSGRRHCRVGDQVDTQDSARAQCDALVSAATGVPSAIVDADQESSSTSRSRRAVCPVHCVRNSRRRRSCPRRRR